MSILDTLNPYMLWIKVGIVAAVVAGSFTAGWTVQGWRCDAKESARLVAEGEAVGVEIKDYKAERDQLDAKNRRLTSTYQRERANWEVERDMLQEEIKNAPLNTITPREGDTDVAAGEPFNREFVRLWNKPIKAVNDGPQGGAAPGLPALAADTSAARVTREDVLNNHAKIVERHAQCKAQLDGLIAFFQKE
jgi:hypothetical protein